MIVQLIHHGFQKSINVVGENRNHLKYYGKDKIWHNIVNSEDKETIPCIVNSLLNFRRKDEKIRKVVSN